MTVWKKWYRPSLVITAALRRRRRRRLFYLQLWRSDHSATVINQPLNQCGSPPTTWPPWAQHLNSTFWGLKAYPAAGSRARGRRRPARPQGCVAPAGHRGLAPGRWSRPAPPPSAGRGRSRPPGRSTHPELGEQHVDIIITRAVTLKKKIMIFLLALNVHWLDCRIDIPCLRFNFQNKGLGPDSQNLLRAFLALCHS